MCPVLSCFITFICNNFVISWWMYFVMIEKKGSSLVLSHSYMKIRRSEKWFQRKVFLLVQSLLFSKWIQKLKIKKTFTFFLNISKLETILSEYKKPLNKTPSKILLNKYLLKANNKNTSKTVINIVLSYC